MCTFLQARGFRLTVEVYSGMSMKLCFINFDLSLCLTVYYIVCVLVFYYYFIIIYILIWVHM
jgi:hypothetical protein